MPATIEKLQKFGLSDKEARVYSCLFELGTSVVSSVAKKAEINRSTAYVLLETLSKRGLVSISKRGKIRVYSAAAPERLVQLAEASLRASGELVGIGNDLLRELKTSSKDTNAKPKVQVFDGIEGIKTVYEDILSTKTEVRSYAAIDSLLASMPEFIPEYDKRQKNKKIRSFMLSPNTPSVRAVLHSGIRNHYKTFLLESKHHSQSELIAYDDKIALISPIEKFSCIVESAEFAKSFKNIFDATLNNAQEWKVRAVEKGEKSMRGKHPVLAKAEKRFWKI